MDWDKGGDIDDIIRLQQEKAGRRYVDVLRSKVDRLKKLLWNSGHGLVEYDQYPGKSVPHVQTCLFGPISATTPLRDAGGNDYLANATLVDLSKYITAANNVLNSRDGTFYICAINSVNYVNIVSSGTPGNIFNPVFPNNGGAIPSVRGPYHTVSEAIPYITFELALYDKTNGGRLNDLNLPMQLCSGGTFTQRELPVPLKMEPGSELEPRLYITEARPYELAHIDRTQFYIQLYFDGYKTLEV